MINTNPKLKQRLQAGGYKSTRPREAIFAFLLQQDPTTVPALIAATGGQSDKASVYRTLALFRHLGIIQDIVVGGQKMIELTDGFDTHHHHIFCIKCHSSTTIEDKLIEQSLNRLANRTGFTLTEHQLELSGICPQCRQYPST